MYVKCQSSRSPVHDRLGRFSKHKERTDRNNTLRSGSGAIGDYLRKRYRLRVVITGVNNLGDCWYLSCEDCCNQIWEHVDRETGQIVKELCPCHVRSPGTDKYLGFSFLEITIVYPCYYSREELWKALYKINWSL